MRVLLKLRKGDEIKHLSHRDYVRAFELALRRAGISVAYSEGFNPRPRMSFGGAIGVGMTSDDERIVLELACRVDPSNIMGLLNSSVPAGMEILEAREVPDDVKRSASVLVTGSVFRFTVSCDGECSIEAAVREILDAREVRVMREREGQSREVDIRPGLVDATLVEDGRLINIDVTLEFGESGTRPHDFVQALKDRLPNLKVHGIHRLEQF